MPFTVWGLAVAQALLMSGNILLVSVSALIGQQLADAPWQITLPVACQFAGLIVATMPAAHLMQRLGRKAGFMLGNLFGLLGAWVALQGLTGETLFDTSGLAGAVAQVVKLGTTHGATTLHFHAADQRAVSLEGTLNAFTAGDLAHGERRVQTTVTLGDNNAFVSLKTLFTAFNYTYLYAHGVTRYKSGDVAAQLFFFKLLDDVAHDISLPRVN